MRLWRHCFRDKERSSEHSQYQSLPFEIENDFCICFSTKKQTNKQTKQNLSRCDCLPFKFIASRCLLTYCLCFQGDQGPSGEQGPDGFPGLPVSFFLFFFLIMEELVLFSCSSWCQWLPTGLDLIFSSAARHVVRFITPSNTRSLYRCPIDRTNSVISSFFYLFIYTFFLWLLPLKA